MASNKVITKGATNQLIFTLTELVTIASPYYLFEFRNDVTMSSVYFIGADISTHTDRFNEFTFIEGTTATLSPTGQWTYRIFQQTSASNLNPDLTQGLLEIGLLKVVGTADVYYENTNLDNTFYVNE